MVAEGYKNTEIGVIPEDWEISTYDDIFDFLKTATYSRAELSVNEEIGYIHYGDIHTKCSSYYLDLNVIKLPTISQIQLKDYPYIQNGDVIVVDASEDYLGVGKSVEVKNIHNKKVISGLHTFLLRGKSNIIVDGFKGLLFYNELVKKQIDTLATGLKVYSISKNTLKTIQIPFPPSKPEQLAIATALSNADALITATEKLVAKKKAIKQGAMQELLKPKEGWKEKTIEEEFEILRGRDLSKSDLDEYGKFNCILYGELFTTYNEVINNIKSKTNNKGGTKSKYGDILFPSSTTTIGIDLAKCSTLLLDNVSLGGDVIILRKKHNNVNPEFISYYLNIICKHAIAEKTKGVTIYHLHGKDLIAIQISYPSLNEQTRIATILSDMDAEISLLEKRLEKQKHIKQGMMQNLLTGKTRLVESVRKEVKKPKHNTQINEAVVISFLVYKFGTEQYPLSRFRYTKYSYLLHRRSEKEACGFDKYAAGPYNPTIRYKGAENIALKNKYITKVQNPKSKKDAFVVNENIDAALNYFNKWYGTGIQKWIEQFRFYKNYYLEVLTTVDKAICELVSQKAPINVQTVKNYIYSIPQWKKKLEKPYFSYAEIQKAIDESKRLFGNR